MAEVNEGVCIVLARMESNPEEFFEAHKEHNKWRWIFSENLREVMTEPEKAAIYEGMKKVRRLEITHKAIATVMPDEDEDEDPYEKEEVTKTLMANTYQPPKKMVINRAQAEMIKHMNGPAK